jgi:DNA repair protein RAD50
MRDQIKKATPKAIEDTQNEIADWEGEIKRLQGLLPVNASIAHLREEIPALEKQIKEQEAKIPALSDKAEKVRFSFISSLVTFSSMIVGQATERFEGLKRESKDIQILKQQAAHVSRSQKEVDRLQQEIASIEEELKATGSTRTADDVQEELDDLSTKL